MTLLSLLCLVCEFIEQVPVGAMKMTVFEYERKVRKLIILERNRNINLFNKHYIVNTMCQALFQTSLNIKSCKNGH